MCINEHAVFERFACVHCKESHYHKDITRTCKVRTHVYECVRDREYLCLGVCASFCPHSHWLRFNLVKKKKIQTITTVACMSNAWISLSWLISM